MTVDELMEELESFPGGYEIIVEHECEVVDVATLCAIDRLISHRGQIMITTKRTA